MALELVVSLAMPLHQVLVLCSVANYVHVRRGYRAPLRAGRPVCATLPELELHIKDNVLLRANGPQGEETCTGSQIDGSKQACWPGAPIRISATSGAMGTALTPCGTMFVAFAISRTG